MKVEIVSPVIEPKFRVVTLGSLYPNAICQFLVGASAPKLGDLLTYDQIRNQSESWVKGIVLRMAPDGIEVLRFGMSGFNDSVYVFNPKELVIELRLKTLQLSLVPAT